MVACSWRTWSISCRSQLYRVSLKVARSLWIFSASVMVVSRSCGVAGGRLYMCRGYGLFGGCQLGDRSELVPFSYVTISFDRYRELPFG